MGLAATDCWELLRTADHGVLATAHQERGVDAVPVVFIVDGGWIVVPIDNVKAKTTTRLQRLANIVADARVVVLAEHYDHEDWTELWWVRANGRAIEAALTDDWAAALAAKYEPYRADGAIESVMVIDVESVSGWKA
jgi:PPOX class probable F420-dependent enzyme